jgi:FkbM family methyltransferase
MNGTSVGIRTFPYDYPRMWARCENEYEAKRLGREKEPGTETWIRSGMGEGTVMWDVGACIGQYGMLAGALGADVVMFEPVSANFARCCDNVGANRDVLGRRVIVLPLALSDRERLADVWLSDTRPGAASHRFMEIDGLTSPGGRVRERVVMMSPGQLTSSRGGGGYGLRPPTHVKIDTDGGESDIVMGICAAMERDPGWNSLGSLMVEEPTGQYSPVGDMLAEHGFVLEETFALNSASVTNRLYGRGI